MIGSYHHVGGRDISNKLLSSDDGDLILVTSCCRVMMVISDLVISPCRWDISNKLLSSDDGDLILVTSCCRVMMVI